MAKTGWGEIVSSRAVTSESVELQDLGAAAQSAAEISGVVETTMTEMRDCLTDAKLEEVLQA